MNSSKRPERPSNSRSDMSIVIGQLLSTASILATLLLGIHKVASTERIEMTKLRKRP